MVTPFVPEGMAKWLEIDEETLELIVKNDAPEKAKKNFNEYMRSIKESMKIE